MGATLGIIGALLGVGGSIGGSFIGSDQQQGASDDARRDARDSRDVVASEVNPLNNPIVAAIAAQSLARLGLADTSFLQGAGPLGQVLESVRQAGFTGFEQSGIFDTLTRMVSRAGEDPQIPANWAELAQQVSENSKDQHNLTLLNQFIPAHLRVGGFQENLAALLQAEQQFQQQVRPFADQLAQIASLSRERQTTVEQALAELTQSAAGGADFDQLLGLTKGSLLRDFSDRRTDALSAANFGGFNPAGTLEALEDARQDLDLLAIERAAGLTNARTSSMANLASLLGALDPSLRAEAGASAAAQIPAQTAALQLGGSNPNQNAGAFGQSISDTGGALALFSIDQLLRNGLASSGSNSPAWSGSGGGSSGGSNTGTFSTDRFGNLGIY